VRDTVVREYFQHCSKIREERPVTQDICDSPAVPSHARPYDSYDDRVGTHLGMLSSLETVAEREGTEDYEEWREAANDEE